jgi:hypothetical protein
VNYLALAMGETPIARARAVQTGKTVCVAQVELFILANGGEAKCALATATLRTAHLLDGLAAAPGTSSQRPAGAGGASHANGRLFELGADSAGPAK